MSAKTVLALCALAGLSACATDFSATPFDEPDRPVPFKAADYAAACEDWDDWDKPAPPFRLYGDTYYVGTCGITALLITSPDGHIVIDSGTEKGGELVLANIASLGFSPRHVRYVTHTQEHHDHIGGIAFLKENTGSRLVASARAQSVFETGIINEDDPQYEMHEPMSVATVDELVANGETIDLGGKQVVATYTPGHSPGAISWSWVECEGDDCRKIVFTDGMGPFARDDYRWSDHPDYLADYRGSLDWLANVDADICMSGHPSQVRLKERIETGMIVDRDECARTANATRERVDLIVAEEEAK